MNLAFARITSPTDALEHLRTAFREPNSCWIFQATGRREVEKLDKASRAVITRTGPAASTARWGVVERPCPRTGKTLRMTFLTVPRADLCETDVRRMVKLLASSVRDADLVELGSAVFITHLGPARQSAGSVTYLVDVKPAKSEESEKRERRRAPFRSLFAPSLN